MKKKSKINRESNRLRLYEHISNVLSVDAFEKIKNELIWARKVNDVLQVITGEYSRGGNFLLNAYTACSVECGIGGGFSHLTINDNFDRGGVWDPDVDDLSEIFENLTAAFSDVALPWFSVANSSENLALMASVNVKWTVSNYKCYFDKTTKLKPISEKYDSKKWWSSDEINTLIESDVNAGITSFGFKRYPGEDHAWLRKRGEVYEYITVVRLNNNVHLGCRIYKWINDLSKTGEEDFNEISKALMLGGMLKEYDIGSYEMPVFITLTETDPSLEIEKFFKLLSVDLKSTEHVTTKYEFYRWIPNKLHNLTILKHLGLEDKWIH